jgi:ferredoxin
MLFSDKFWGQRWLAWTSGWIMLAGIWITGTMGYWLIWDLRGQWMTEYMMETIAGTSGLTYVAADIESRTFSNFVIILFLHVFLPLIGFFGVYIHGVRLSRARWWSPRWVSIQATVGLIILSLIKPVQSFAQADLSHLIKSVPMDAYYLGFLPVIEYSGNAVFWGLALLIGGSLFILPWISKGKDLGPAVVENPKCTGCSICYAECPYDAIRMIERQDETKYHKLAIINENQCTGCGICAGACPTDAINLHGGYNSEQTYNALKGALKREIDLGNAVTILFASHRDEALESLPARITSGREDSPVRVFSWDEGKNAARVIEAILPSVGAVNIEWVKHLHQQGARDIIILSQPYDDSLNREDAHWMLNRLHLRPALVTNGVHWLEVTPGDSKAVESLLNRLHNNQEKKPVTVLPPVKERSKMLPSLVSGLVGTVLLLGMFALALPLDISAGTKAAEQSALRFAIDAKGKVDVSAIPEGVVLPEGADAAKIFGGSHFPISVRVMLDGKTILEEIYKPSGISGNGRISALEFLQIKSGVHQIEVWMKDDTNDFRLAYSGEATFEQSRALILSYDEKLDMFVLR